MTSFLVNCSQCNNFIARDTRCPNCNYLEQPTDPTGQSCISADGSVRSVADFKTRYEKHLRNSRTIMLLQIAAGGVVLVTGVLSAFRRVMWKYLARQSRLEMDRPALPDGELFSVQFASPSVLLLTGLVVLVVLVCGGILTNAHRFFPTALHCPECEEQLDTLNIEYDYCPGCRCQLTEA